MKGQQILIVSPEAWSHIYVSKHHYAIELSKQNNVYFLNPPSSEFNITSSSFDSLYILNYPGFLSGLRFFPKWFRKWSTKVIFIKLQRTAGISFDIIWNFDTSVFFQLDSLPRKLLKIMHIVDLNQNFQISKAVRTADICFTNLHSYQERLLELNRNTFFINHGFDNTREYLPIEINKTKTFVCIYAGNLAIPYIDIILIEEVISQNNSVEFVFLGPYEEDTPLYHQLKGYTNCRFEGMVKSSLLHSYYKTADILWLVYKESEVDQCANPHKMMEYLGSGTPIIATNTLEYQSLAKKNLISMSQLNREFPSLFKKFLREYDSWNSMEMRQSRIAFAKKNTYRKQIKRIEKHIKSIG